MEKLIKQLDANFEYVDDTMDGDTLVIRVRSVREEAECPFCHQMSNRVHDCTPRVLQDLPAMGSKVRIVLLQRKMKCTNPSCSRRTFAERFECFEPFARRTNRLNDKIVDLTLNTSAVSAAASMREGICDVGKSTLCTLLKKNAAGRERRGDSSLH